MSAGPVRLVLRAHGPTTPASALVLGEQGPLLRPPAPVPLDDGAGPAWCAPGPAAAQTAAGLGRSVRVVPELRGPDLGGWAGRPLAELAERDGEGLAAWLRDPDARPHGGETLAELVARLAALLTGEPALLSGEGDLWVAEPLVVRAAVVAALAAPPALVLALDVAHGGSALLTGGGGRWRLAGLARAGLGRSG